MTLAATARPAHRLLLAVWALVLVSAQALPWWQPNAAAAETMACCRHKPAGSRHACCARKGLHGVQGPVWQAAAPCGDRCRPATLGNAPVPILLSLVPLASVPPSATALRGPAVLLAPVRPSLPRVLSARPPPANLC